MAINLRGRSYFKHGPWFEWRLPGLGAEPVNRESAPEIYMPEHNVPFKESNYNVRDELARDLGYTTVLSKRPYSFSIFFPRNCHATTLFIRKLDPKNPYHAETLRITQGLKSHIFANEVIPEDKELAAEFIQNWLRERLAPEVLAELPINSVNHPIRFQLIYEPHFMVHYNRAVAIGIFHPFFPWRAP